MKNSELFTKDPTTFTIPNDGVATIQVPSNSQEWEVLEFELRSFVCEGEYKQVTCPPKPDPHTMLRIRPKETGNAQKATILN